MIETKDTIAEDVAPKSVADTVAPPKKRGRPANATSGAARSNADVEQALAVLDTAYQFITLGLTMIGASVSAGELAAKLEYVQAQNKAFLLADKKLAQTIAKVGASTGRAGFIAVNVMALAPIVSGAAKELQLNRKPKQDTATE